MSASNPKRPGGTLYRWKEYAVGYAFILPWVIGFAVFMAFPLGWSFYLSFNKVRMSADGFKYEWLGLQNFKDALFKDSVYPVQLLLYVQEMLLIIPMIIIFALLVAILLNQNFPGRFLFRAVFFLPVILRPGRCCLSSFPKARASCRF